LTWLLFILAFVTTVSLLANGLDAYLTASVSWPVALFLYVIPFVFSMSIVIALPLVRLRFLDGLKMVQDQTDLKLWPYLKKLTTSDLIALVGSRIKSLIALTSSIFMTRIRDLGFKDIFVYPKYNKRLIPNLIYDLNDPRRFGKEIQAQKLEPTAEFQQIAAAAEEVPTGLWFTNEETLRKLIVCGHITTCFNLLRYILKYKAIELETPNSPIQALYVQAEKLWNDLKSNPYLLMPVTQQQYRVQDQ
jgi:hypothetical protein